MDSMFVQELRNTWYKNEETSPVSEISYSSCSTIQKWCFVASSHNTPECDTIMNIMQEQSHVLCQLSVASGCLDTHLVDYYSSLQLLEGDDDQMDCVHEILLDHSARPIGPLAEWPNRSTEPCVREDLPNLLFNPFESSLSRA